MNRLLAVLATALLLAGCGTQDPLQANRTQSDSIVVGSADFHGVQIVYERNATAPTGDVICDVPIHFQGSVGVNHPQCPLA